MATTGRPVESALAAVESAGFVRIVSSADGDALAASAVLARALDDRGTAFQVSVARTVGARRDRAEDGDADTTVVVGAADVDADAPVESFDPSDRPASVAAWELARSLETSPDPDPVLALAGAFSAGVEPGAGETEPILEAARSHTRIEDRPGVAVPTADLADGLAHSTLLSAPWSGDPAATEDALAALETTDPDEDDHRRVGSLVALEAVGAETASTRAAHAIARVLRPHATPEGPFATVGGYADVLDVTARSAPGTGIALAMGHDVRESALECWREHGRTAHAALSNASTGRYDGLYVLGGVGPVETVARIAGAYRSPESAVLAIGEGEAAVTTVGDRPLPSAFEETARDLGADYDIGRDRGYLSYDPATEDETIISEVRAAL